MNDWRLTQPYLWSIMIIPWIIVVAIITVQRMYPDRLLDERVFLLTYIPLEVLRICICANIFIVRIIPSKFGLDLRSLVIATPFLIAAIFFTLRLVGNIVLPTTINPEASNQVLYFRTAARWSIVIFLLAATFIPDKKGLSVSFTAKFTGAVLVSVVLLSFLIIRFTPYLPPLFMQNGGTSPFARVLGYTAIVLSFFGAYRYGSVAVGKNDVSNFFIAASLASAVPTEYAFLTVYNEDDVFRLAGNVFGAIGFVLAFFGLMNRSVVRPYENILESERALKDANKELEAYNYSVSHDLRAPLRSIFGFSKILLEDYGEKLDAEGKELLCRICGSATKMNKLIDDLLRLSRVTRQEMELSDANLSEIAESVVKGIQAAHPDATTEFNVEKNITAPADPKLVEILLDNLIGNAWKFTSKREHARIEVGRVAIGDETIYFVKDNGAGFDQRLADKLFLPFQRLHSSDEFEGTGIGLAIAERIVRKHNGRIWAEGRAGIGATFYFTLKDESKGASNDQ
jgi:signal transduction histidine kinase